MLTLLSNLIGIGATLTALTFLAASGANSSPRDLRVLKTLAVVVALIGVSSCAGSFVAYRAERVDVAGWLGLAPLLFAIALVIVCWNLEL